ncbi:ester cyclase [Asanoa sp. NPDC049573]|uniref:ester cyclase n=1 Tax=Asanoa sp. NPDC049573 TaxID=3155396 RepID=UPI00342B0D95
MALLDDLLSCWERPVADRADPLADFAAVYADPVTVNGVSMAVADLVARARMLQGAFAGLRADIVHRVETADTIVVGFVLRGRHVGTYPSPLGEVAATGREVVVRTIDILTVTAGRVSDIWVISDDLGLLTQLGAVGR